MRSRTRQPYTETLWHAQAALDRDVMQVFVVRYHWPEHPLDAAEPRRPLRMEYLHPCGGWVSYREYETIMPALTIPGFLVHSLTTARQSYPTLEAQKVMDLLRTVMENEC